MAAQAGVAGRFQFQHGMRFDRVEGRKMRRMPLRPVGGDLAAEAAVAQQRLHRAVSHRAGHGVILPEAPAAVRAQAIVQGVGGLHDGGLCRVLGEMQDASRFARPCRFWQGQGITAT